MISAEVICDSLAPHGKRITTFKLRYPKFIHGEFMTHRVISRNASSSRAIPTAKLLEEVRSDVLRAAPVFWGKNQPGMQAAVELDDYPPPKEVKAGTSYMSPRMEVQIAWTRAAMNAAHEAEQMLKWGAHKQIVNRLLEPFSHINVIATATQWDNFFGLRLNKDAQPEMRALAIAMWEARGASRPRAVSIGEWHLPFTDEFRARDGGHPFHVAPLQELLKISVARCARVSYESFDTGKRSTVEEDLALFDRLGASGHWSPFEHQATPDAWCGEIHGFPWSTPHEHGNFVGWRQYRKMFGAESCAPLPEEFC